MKKIRLVLPLLLMVGCIDLEDDELGSDVSDLYVTTATLWRGPANRGNIEVPLCREPAQAPLTWDSMADVERLTLDQARRSWQRVSGIRFVDRGACATTGSELMIRIRNRGFWSSPGALSGGSTKQEGMAALMPPATGFDTMSMAIEVPVWFNSATSRNERRGTDDRIRFVAAHELGHVIGFAHEHDRNDDTRAADCRTIWGGGPTPGAAITPYDPDSIMNYCQTAGSINGNLSPLDIQGVRKLYGWRDATDYDNDGKSNLAVFRGGYWYVTGVVHGEKFGEPGDVPIAGDFDNDGASDIAVWRPSGSEEGWWFVRNSSGSPSETRFQWGANGDIPTTGDLDGDGLAEFIVYRPSTRTFYIRKQDGTSWTYTWGEAGDIPVLADYDGDGITDLALYRPSGSYAGYWFVLNSTTPGFYAWMKYGTTGDIPVVGDYDGDARSDLAVWRPSTGRWYVSRSGGGPEYDVQWGASTDIPVSLDWDGDGVTELAVWRPSTGTWFIRTPAAPIAAIAYGVSGDIPLGRTIR